MILIFIVFKGFENGGLLVQREIQWTQGLWINIPLFLLHHRYLFCLFEVLLRLDTKLLKHDFSTYNQYGCDFRIPASTHYWCCEILAIEISYNQSSYTLNNFPHLHNEDIYTHIKFYKMYIKVNKLCNTIAWFKLW